MNRRVAHRCLTWLLPLLVLRSLVPAGFMLASSGGDLQMMLCSGLGPVAILEPSTAGDHSAHASRTSHAEHTSHHEHHGSTQPQAHESSLCPFAAAAPSGASTPVHAVVAFVPLALERFDFSTRPELRSRPIPIDRIRGPPSA